jgi:O-Antigen ligase
VPLVIIIDLIVICGICRIALVSGLEAALPFASFMMVAVPIESSIPLGLFELTTQRLIIALLLLLYAAGKQVTQRQVNLPMPLKLLFLLHVSWCVLSTANSVVPLMSIKKAVSVILEYYTLYFIYWKVISSTETIRKILFAIVLAMIVCSVFGAFEAYGAPNVLRYFPKVGHHFDMLEYADREVRVQVTFDHPILYGAALATAIITTLYLVTVVEKRWQRIVLWVGLMLMFLNIYKTSSRGPWLDAILGCTLLLLLSGGKIRRNILVILALSIASMIVRPGIWGTVKGIYDNSFDMNTTTGTSYQYRYALQHAVTNKLLQSPTRAIWGYGLESFYDLRIVDDFLGKPHLFESCDSSWAELMIETGFVGLGILILILGKPLWRSFRDYWTMWGPDRYLSLMLFVNLVVFYFQMYSVGMYSWGQNGYMLWMLIAITFAYPACLDEEEQENMDEMDDLEQGVGLEVVTPGSDWVAERL